MSLSVYCGNCDHGPILLGCLEDGEKTRCTSCGVYMHDSIASEDFDEDYCHGCESGVDAAHAHSERCQQREMDRPGAMPLQQRTAPLVSFVGVELGEFGPLRVFFRPMRSKPA